jgi:PelA/Pel-15E family pectate lyase
VHSHSFISEHFMTKYFRLAGLALIAASISTVVAAATPTWSGAALQKPPGWYATTDARAAADSVLRYQSDVGAWPKNTDLFAPITDAALAELQRSGSANTIDNDATTAPMRFLALVAGASGDAKYRDSVVRGVDYLLAAQYPNGGFPQFHPLRESGYYSHITYNDDAMVNALELLRDIAESRAPFGFVDAARRERARDSVARGIDVILKTQVRQNGKLTAWCAQHDEKTLAPAWARAYEPPSLSGNESVGITRFLMAIDKPSPPVIEAVEAAVTWLRAVPIKGQRLDSTRRGDGRTESFLVPDPSAPPLWARFYELGTDRPLYMDRDSKPRYDFAEIGVERRSGYAYHGTWPASLLEKDYPAWRARIGASAMTTHAPVIVDGVAIQRQERPHGDVGLTTVYRYTDAVKNPAVVLRGRTFHVGAAWGDHDVTHDQIYYVESGEMEMVTNGVTRRLTPGMTAFVYDKSLVRFKQVGSEPLALIMAWRPAPPAVPGAKAAAGPRAPVVLNDATIAKTEPPHGGIGTSIAYRYSDFASDRAVHFRRRTLQPGAEIVEHTLPWDQGYVGLDGKATVTIDGAKHSLQPGVAMYAYKGSALRIVPQAGGAASYLLIEPVPAPVPHREPMRVSEAAIGVDERAPEGGVGDSTAFDYTHLTPGLEFELRKRILRKGATVGARPLDQDRVFYVLEGEIEFVVDGTSHRLKRGMAVYARKGASTKILQHGASQAAYLAAWALPE